MTASPRPSTYVTVGLLAGIAAIAGVAGIWAGVAAMTSAQCSWIAPLAALDAALLLRLANWPPGRARAALATGITLATVLAANLLVATALIGRAMGLRPVEALSRMSLDLAWLHAASNSSWPEAAWYGLALVLAWLAGR